jgi:hypothetical protein
MKNILPISLLLSAGLLSGCGSKTSDYQAPVEKMSYVTVAAAKTQSMADPKVNILFVVDNSGSMKGYQDKLAKNMQLFSNRFFSNSRIDYRIGVVPVYDSKYLNDQTVYRSGKRKMNALAELVPLKGLAPSDHQNQLYITRDTIDPKKVLQETVAIGTQWGPEAEESFSPVLAIADPTINHEKNQDFYQDDAYLAVIFLTDADDVTPGVSGDDFYQRLVAMKNNDRSKILIAAALPSLNNHAADCTKDGRGPLQSFPALLAASGALVADLCSANFGSRLAEFGQYLVQRVGSQIIPLSFTPDIKTLQVSYGAANSSESERIQLVRGSDGYFFNPDRNEVMISPNLKIERQDDAIIFVKAIPANMSNLKNGQLNQL